MKNRLGLKSFLSIYWPYFVSFQMNNRDIEPSVMSNFLTLYCFINLLKIIDFKTKKNMNRYNELGHKTIYFSEGISNIKDIYWMI